MWMNWCVFFFVDMPHNFQLAKFKVALNNWHLTAVEKLMPVPFFLWHTNRLFKLHLSWFGENNSFKLHLEKGFGWSGRTAEKYHHKSGLCDVAVEMRLPVMRCLDSHDSLKSLDRNLLANVLKCSFIYLRYVIICSQTQTHIHTLWNTDTDTKPGNFKVHELRSS